MTRNLVAYSYCTFKILLSLLWFSNPTVLKFYEHSTLNFTRLVIPLYLRSLIDDVCEIVGVVGKNISN